MLPFWSYILTGRDGRSCYNESSVGFRKFLSVTVYKDDLTICALCTVMIKARMMRLATHCNVWRNQEKMKVTKYTCDVGAG
jgi:hypothetical protein